MNNDFENSMLVFKFIFIFCFISNFTSLVHYNNLVSIFSTFLWKMPSVNGGNGKDHMNTDDDDDDEDMMEV